MAAFQFQVGSSQFAARLFTASLVAACLSMAALAGCGGGGGSSSNGAQTSVTPDPAAGLGSTTAATPTAGVGAVTRSADGPAVDGCPAFRSGRYFVVSPKQQTEVREAIVDATTVTMTQAGVSAPQLALNMPCDYSYNNGTARVTVSKAGLAMIRYAGATATVELAIPEQALTLADLAGAWNLMAYREVASGAGASFRHGKMTVAADGSIAIADCSNGVGACSAAASSGTIEANPAGGFLIKDTSSVAGKPVYGLRAADGQMMLIMTDPKGVQFAASDRAQTLPVGGNVINAWELVLNNSGTASDLTQGDYLVSALTPVVQTYERYRLADGQTDEIMVNSPRDGLMHRSAGSYTPAGGGAAIPFAEQILLPMDSIGLTLYASVTAVTADGYLGFIIAKPVN